MRRRVLALVMALAAGSSALACAKVGAFMRPHTYGPNFDYISKEQVKSVMWQLARDVNRIDALVNDPAGVGPEQRDEIARLLVIMEDATGRLGREGIRTNHPLVDEHRDQFRADLEAARRGVSSEPPSYTLTKEVSGACLHCHRHGTR
jgi:hypothetical protein